ncbi:hypothetical protein DS2_12869 [Catenovulum agarivorans DS-2]|uniref:Iminophenyl-pyruvate dimer synthase domain-containing protein n=1 Tax=Catenovulum agarivorans DS-2 TaxID=1328313 RepID=W7QBQ8_9ALTE|nr:ferritin-like protein [Catenovulum agarivorans]EWH09426.1 hypothetical protein DS2_12869 [Catenovulum agarivorans DS-2]
MDATQKLAKIQQDLQTAIELELSTLPPYLTAYFSIHPGTNVAAANAIRSVFMEEMLHLCLAGNTLVSIGGQVKLGKDNIPKYPLTLEFKGREFAINLEKFSKSAIQTFRRIELPDGMPPLELSLKAQQDLNVDGYSIGEFYHNIIKELVALDNEYSKQGKHLFSQDTSSQITETYFWRGGGKPIAVTDISSAKQALNEIIDQGEGAAASLYDGDYDDYDQHQDLAHYYKFSQVYYGRHYLPDDDPKMPPTGEPIEVNYQQVYSMVKNPTHQSYAQNPDLQSLNHKFNQAYSLMLQQIEQAFSGNPRVLYNAIMNGMHDLSPIATTMAKIELDPAKTDGLTGCPSFEWVEPVE